MIASFAYTVSLRGVRRDDVAIFILERKFYTWRTFNCHAVYSFHIDSLASDCFIPLAVANKKKNLHTSRFFFLL